MTRSAPPPTSISKAGTDERRRLYSTNELAASVGVTPRTVRFYEAQGLLQPQRAGIMRVYTYRDRARLALIRRGKRLGFSLQDIAEVLALYNVDPVRTEHARAAIKKARGRIAELEEKMTDLQQTLRELRKLEQQATAQLTTHQDDTGLKSRDKGRHR
ncbi:MAG: MerR family DNA-binding transcriptional regulator [Rhodospirillaceae bacterium]|nr:MAG: MerR family DNA-binding transcriptional regulator [Rhodospirillaceae bacterium]